MTTSVSWLREGVSDGATEKGGNRNCVWGGRKSWCLRNLNTAVVSTAQGLSQPFPH